MTPRLFVVSLMGAIFCMHLLRFPHLLLEQGGGAFLILFFVVLNSFAFPMLIVERVLDRKLKDIDIGSLIYISKSSRRSLIDRIFVFFWFTLRGLLLFSFLWFFLYLGSSSAVYLIYYLKSALHLDPVYADIPAVPDLEFSLLGAVVWAGGSYMVFARAGHRVFSLFPKWILPFFFTVLFVLLLKIVVRVNDTEGFKILFYPDFSALTPHSLISVIGHSLVCLFVGFGFYKPLFRANLKMDPIELFIRAALMALVLCVFIGLMALPMIEQVRETPFGSNWIFEILPRWLSYGNYGNYYCSLFFLSLSVITFYVGLMLFGAIQENRRLLYRFRKNKKWKVYGNLVLVWINAAIILVLQKALQGWTGQSLLITMDTILVNGVLPLFALMMIWVMFRHTSRSERLAVFGHQQVFFHNKFFFQIWEWLTLLGLPFLVLLGWALTFL